MGKKEDKTNVMRILDQKKIEYNHYSYDNMTTCAKDVAAGLGVDPQFLYKTLVTVGKSKEHYVFMVPGEEELDLKKAAIAVGEKKHRNDSPKGAFAPDGIYPRRMFAHRNEKTV